MPVSFSIPNGGLGVATPSGVNFGFIWGCLCGAPGFCSWRWRVLYVGGNWSNRLNAGLFYFNANNTSSNSNSNIGARQLVNYYCTDFSAPLGENIVERTGFSKFFLNNLADKQGSDIMPKRIGFLCEKMLDKTFIRSIIIKASKHKRSRRDVRKVLRNLDFYTERLYNILKTESFVPATPHEHDIYDASSQKWRAIKVVPFFPDSIIHWILVETMKPVLMRGMHHWSCASIPGRGGIHANRYIKRVLRNHPKNSKYAVEIDIKKFYPSIPIERLNAALSRKIKDKKFLKIVSDILKSCGGGLAIGYYICQWLANFYLEPLDHFILSIDGVKYMVRYMDNITIFGANKKKLRKARAQIAEFMKDKLGVEMKGNWQIYPTAKRMVSAVGYRFSKTHVILRKRNFLRLTRQCRRAIKKINAGKQVHFQLAAGLISRIGQIKHCDSHKIRVKYIDPIGIKNLKEVIRNENKRRFATKQCVYT